MQGIDFFAGAGGMSIGAQQAGISVIKAIEKDINAARTYTLNHPTVSLIVDDIKNIKTIEVEDRTEPLIIFGGPPCQGFSTSNQKTRKQENPQNWLFAEFLRLIGKIKPDWVILENVKGLIETEQGFFFDKIIGRLRKLGYGVDYFILNSEDFGVPQSRSRIFIIGSLDKARVNPFEKKINTIQTVRSAIDDLPNLENGANIDLLPYKYASRRLYAKEMRNKKRLVANNLVSRNSDLVLRRYENIPQGSNWEAIPSTLMENYSDASRCHTGLYHRLEWDRPSIVIGNFRKNMLIHPNEHRGLSVREAARLQSFPDSFEFLGSIGFQQQQVGNAVPPLLAKAVFESIIELYL